MLIALSLLIFFITELESNIFAPLKIKLTFVLISLKAYFGDGIPIAESIRSYSKPKARTFDVSSPDSKSV